MAPTRRPVGTTSVQNDLSSRSSSTSSSPTLETTTSAPSTLTDPHNTNNTTTIQDTENTLFESLCLTQPTTAELETAKVNHWRNNPYAAGLVEPTWKDELSRHRRRRRRVNVDVDVDVDVDEYEDANGPNRRCCEDAFQEDIDPTCGCLYVSGVVCGWIGAGRVGNMAVLKERTVVVTEPVVVENVDAEDLEPGDDGDVHHQPTERKVSQRQIHLVVGPYWPMMLCVTYPLILGISFWTATSSVFVRGQNPVIITLWCWFTFALIYSLYCVAFKDPGILPRHRVPPPPVPASNGTRGASSAQWRWNDQAQTYRPPGAMYDPDCAVVIEEFDHTCPWTGTGIGKKNMCAFQCFLFHVFFCLVMDILLLTKASIA